MNTVIQNRYEFVLLFDVIDGNPNGDPDAGNLPRVDPETGNGLVTDVCLKRKVRNYVAIAKQYKRPYDIYVKEKSVLGRSHVEAFQDLDIKLCEESRLIIPDGLLEVIEDLTLPEGLDCQSDEHLLIVHPDADKKELQNWIKENAKEKIIAKDVADFFKKAIKEAKSRKPSAEESTKGREKMCEWFFDIRTFGAVMSLKSAPNCGQVRGPVQLTFARSINQVVPLEHSITRMAVATEAEAEKQGGDNRTMGRKFTIPYGLYRTHGFISAHLAEQTGFSEDDLELLWEALTNMFEHDRSAARGQMATRGLYVFRHDNKLGRAPAHVLFDHIRVTPTSSVPRRFEDFAITVDDNMPDGVQLLRLVG